MTTARHVLLTVFVALGLATLLNAASLLAAAERVELGPRRDLAVSLATPVAEASARLGLDRPHALGREWLGRDQPRSLRGLSSGLSGPPQPEEGERLADPGGLASEEASTEDGSVPPYEPALRSEQGAEPAAREVSPEDPLRVWVLGDSLMEHLGPALVRDLEGHEAVRAELDWHYSTGLSRPDYFDWPARMEARLAEGGPDAIIVLFGGNDGQNIEVGDRVLRTATPPWAQEYARRVIRFAEILEAEDRRVYWVGLPVMREAYDARKAGVMNEAYAAGVRGRPGFRFVPTWSLFSDAQGRYSEYLPDETGRRRLHRAGDGIHFTRAGARRLSRVLVDLLEREWELDRWWQMQPRLGCTLGETEELR